MKIKKLIPIFFVGLVALLPLAAMGVTAPPTNTWTSWEDIEGFVEFVKNAVYTIFLLVIVICLVLAAFNFITAGGDETKISKAKEWVKYALIGGIIALLAGGMIALLTDLLSAPTTTP
jgi:fumarate reductase subunit D